MTMKQKELYNVAKDFADKELKPKMSKVFYYF